MAHDLTGAARPVDVDRLIYATITLMSGLIIYDGWAGAEVRRSGRGDRRTRVGDVPSHVFSASLAQQLALGRPVTMGERMTIVRAESRFLLTAMPTAVAGAGDPLPSGRLVERCHPLGPPAGDGVARVLGWGRWVTLRTGGWRLVLAVVAGLLIGALILTLQVLLQPGKAVTTASHETWAKPLGLTRER